MNIIHPHLTAKRRYWLERLRDEGPQEIPGITANHLCRLGWVSRLMSRDGALEPLDDVIARYEPSVAGSHARAREDGWYYAPGYAITQDGLDALKRAPMAGATLERPHGPSSHTIELARDILLAAEKADSLTISRRLLADLIYMASEGLR